MKLYNTLSRETETIAPQNPPTVTVYTCGPTVYDYPHIGNWFTFTRYDVLIRVLKAVGLQPRWVMNITDVGHLVSDADEGEDKLEAGARREGKTAWDIADYYGNYFIDGLKRLNITQPYHLPKATDHIPEQIAIVQTLERKGYTYTIDDGVYFDTSKFPTYADFAKLDLSDQQAGARVETNPQKRNPQDFALWKFSPHGKARDMEWDSPWGRGFPGWHLECSAMSMKYLGETLDIHGGGVDHIPVHHTNEIAQSEAATGKTFANIWMHANHISINGQKISKSLGNGITLEDIEAKGYSLATLRLHILESHYRTQSKFSWESLEAAKHRLAGYYAMADRYWQPDDTAGTGPDFGRYQKLMTEALLDDLNTPQALAHLSELATLIESSGVRTNDLNEFKAFLEWIEQAMGIKLLGSELSDSDKLLLQERQAARDSKNWQLSDEIRDKLAGRNIAVKDTPHGQIWSRAV